jgi:hypothetical protein
MSLPPFVLAIDPGVNGAYAWQTDGVPPDCAPFVGPEDLRALYNQWTTLPFATLFNFGEARKIAYLEEVSGFAGTARTGRSMFTFGRSFGRTEAWLVACHFEIHRVRPQAWQKKFSCLSRKGETRHSHKKRLLALARERASHLLQPKINARTADAYLLLCYGWENERDAFREVVAVETVEKGPSSEVTLATWCS